MFFSVAPLLVRNGFIALAQPVLVKIWWPAPDIVKIVGSSTIAFLQPAAKAALAAAVAEKGERPSLEGF